MKRIYNNLLKYTTHSSAIIILAIFQSSTITAGALLPFTAYDLRMVNLGQHYRDPDIKLNPTASCSSQLSNINNNVFFVGDSLTNGMVRAGLLDIANEGGFGAETEHDVVEAPNNWMNGQKVRYIGQSVESTGGYDIPSTIATLSERSQLLSPQNAGIIVIGLGTNKDDDPARRTNELLEYVRGINSTADIYWINTYFKPDQDDYVEINNAIQQVADERKDFTVIDFATEASNSDMYPLSIRDQTHHTGKGYENKAKFVINQLKAGPGGDGSSCTKNSSGNNEKDAFDYLSEEYGPVIAAGIIANFRHESGSNPVRMQCIYSVENGAEKGIDASLLDPDGGVRLKNFDAVLAKLVTPEGKYCDLSSVSSVGWGIVQWTPFSKIVDPLKGMGVADELIEDLYYQLDLVISQLEGTEPAVSINLSLKGVGDELKTATTPERAAEIFAVRYEGCRQCQEGESQYAARSAEAVDVLTRYGSQ